MTNKQIRTLVEISVSFVLTIFFVVLSVEGIVAFLLYLMPYLLVGWRILFDAVRGVVNKQPFDENFLMAVATIGAFALGEYAEGVFVMLFYQLGELFQSYAVEKSRKNIASLMDIRPDYANVLNENNEIIKVDPYDVSVGDVIFVMPGEKVPLDGVVIAGESTIDTSALTGESIPRFIACGNSIISGSVNLTGMIKIRVNKEFGESTASKILELVENASSKKANSEKFISKFAKIYTPAVCISALVLAIFPPLFQLIISGGNSFALWIYRALTFLVISCPCALVVSVPLGFFACIGGAGKKGILIKGANYIETLSRVKCVIFDKTGTLTEGVFEVVDVYTNNFERDKLIEYSALAECFSNHPISESLRKSYGKVLDKSRVSCFTEKSGFGVTAKIDEIPVIAGNSKLMNEFNIKFKECEEVGTVVHIAVNGQYAGYVLISDRIKQNSEGLLDELKKIGVEQTVMLTGDRQNIGEYVANKIGIDTFFAELLPEDKVNKVEELIKSKENDSALVFVGDGVNDAPVLSRADIGIAMGGLGSDAAIEAADVVIMDDDPIKIATSIKLSSRCMRIVRQNIYFSIGVKVLFLILSAFGLTNMWLAIFADVGVMVIAVLNSIRTLGLREI